VPSALFVQALFVQALFVQALFVQALPEANSYWLLVNDLTPNS